MKRFLSFFYSLISIIVFLIIWEIFAEFLANPYFPGPISVFKALIRIALFGDIDGYTLIIHIYASLERVMTGFFIAIITGIPLGLFIGIFPIVRSLSLPIIEPIRFIPPIAWIPLSIILLVGMSRYAFLIWIGAFFPILLNTIAGVKRTSLTLIQMAKAFGANRSQVIAKIIFPSSLPEIMTGLRVGLGVGWMCIVAAEMVGGDPIGLGRLIIKYANLLQTDVIIAGMISIGIIGLCINYMILALEKRMFKWRIEITT